MNEHKILKIDIIQFFENENSIVFNNYQISILNLLFFQNNKFYMIFKWQKSSFTHAPETIQTKFSNYIPYSGNYNYIPNKMNFKYLKHTGKAKNIESDDNNP